MTIEIEANREIKIEVRESGTFCVLATPGCTRYILQWNGSFWILHKSGFGTVLKRWRQTETKAILYDFLPQALAFVMDRWLKGDE